MPALLLYSDWTYADNSHLISVVTYNQCVNYTLILGGSVFFSLPRLTSACTSIALCYILKTAHEHKTLNAIIHPMLFSFMWGKVPRMP